MHGGVVPYRGAPGNARSYVERDRSCADDYYLAEGDGVAIRYVADRDVVREAGVMDAETYERWVAGIQIDGPRAGWPKGRLRTGKDANRFMEFTVNGPKTWSLAAALEPDIAKAYDRAQERAARQVIAWLAQHSTTRVGPRGRQVQVPVEEIEVAVIRHYTSRAGDPHRHLHVQLNARVWALLQWRGLHTVGMRDSIEAINGIGHAAVMSDPEFRAVLAAYGYSLDLESGEIVELEPYARAFSARSRQIEQNMDRYEAEWRREHPEEQPGPALRQAWDRRAWAEERPDKVVPRSGEELEAGWRELLSVLGFRRPARRVEVGGAQPGVVDRDAMAAEALVRLGARRSAWNGADARGEVERLIVSAGVVTDGSVRTDLAEDVTARVLAGSRPLVERDDVPEHVRSMTSPRVLAAEKHLAARFTKRAAVPARAAASTKVARLTQRLDPEQRAAAARLAGNPRLVVVEGAAGSGKTATLAAARALVAGQRRRMVVVAPTLRSAKVATDETGAAASSAARLLYEYGFRWDDHGHWGRLTDRSAPRGGLRRGDLLVVDEAGMLDQDTALALMIVAEETGARLALVGDRHQLPAVGRGGVLDLAARYASAQCVGLDGVRRFADPEYAGLSLRMRNGDDPAAVFDELCARGQIVIHPSEVERLTALAELAITGGDDGAVVVADTREAAGRINTLVHHTRYRAGQVSNELVTASGERIGVGDRIATRRNDPDADVANRETWTVTAADQTGLTVRGAAGRRHLPAAYARGHVELAYAVTTYGIQGATAPAAHVVVGHHTSAASAYVGMTRGREVNVAHLVAENVDEARQQWVDVFGRDRADLGPGHAAGRVIDDIDRYGPRPTGRRVPRRDSRLDPISRSSTPARSGPAIGM